MATMITEARWWRYLFGIALLAFVLPFFTVSCTSQPDLSATVNGLNLVFGGQPAVNVPPNSPYAQPQSPAGQQPGNVQPQGLAVLAFVIAAVGLILGFIRLAIHPAVPGGIGLASAVLLWMMYQDLQNQVIVNGRGMFAISWGVGFWLALLSLLGAVALAGLAWLELAQAAGQGWTAVPTQPPPIRSAFGTASATGEVVARPGYASAASGPVSRCPSCRQEVPGDARHCPWCRAWLGGSAAAAQRPADTASRNRCPSCRKEVTIDATHCPWCRAWLGERAVAPPAPSPQPAPAPPSPQPARIQPAPIAQPAAPGAAERFIYCFHCGARLPVEARFCIRCGTAQPAEPAVTPVPNSSMPAQPLEGGAAADRRAFTAKVGQPALPPQPISASARPLAASSLSPSEPSTVAALPRGDQQAPPADAPLMDMVFGRRRTSPSTPAAPSPQPVASTRAEAAPGIAEAADAARVPADGTLAEEKPSSGEGQPDGYNWKPLARKP